MSLGNVGQFLREMDRAVISNQMRSCPTPTSLGALKTTVGRTREWANEQPRCPSHDDDSPERGTYYPCAVKD